MHSYIILGHIILSSILLGNSLASSQDELLFYIKPTENTTCPGEPCYTLQQVVYKYMHHQFPIVSISKYKKVTLNFLQGVHYISIPFHFQSNKLSYHWTLTGISKEPKNNIVKLGLKSRLWFEGIENLTIKYLSIQSDNSVLESSGLHIHFVRYVLFHKFIFLPLM